MIHPDTYLAAGGIAAFVFVALGALALWHDNRAAAKAESAETAQGSKAARPRKSGDRRAAAI